MAATTFGLLNLLWEVAQLPFYTLWKQGTLGSIAFAIAHCTVGDVLIGLFAASLSIVLTRFLVPRHSAAGASFLVVFVIFGIGYTVFSEWLNVFVWKSWAYSDLMPIIPPLGTGLSPLLQWLLVPIATYFIVFWRTCRHQV